MGEAFELRGEVEDLTAELAALRAERDGLREIVERLPKTADGVPIRPGMRVWIAGGHPDDAEILVTGVTNFNACGCDGDGEESYHDASSDCHPDCDSSSPANRCYSTREAAELARKETE